RDDGEPQLQAGVLLEAGGGARRRIERLGRDQGAEQVRIPILAFCLALAAANVSAQTRPARRAPTRELDVGVAWIGRTSFGSSNANLTNGSGGNVPLFTTATELGAGAAIEARLGYQLTRRLRAEAGGSWLRSELRTQTSGDF